jgi:hypothetical protein
VFAKDDLRIATASHRTEFEEVFEQTDAQSSAVKDNNELIAFLTVLRRHIQDAETVAKDRPSNLKAATMTVHFAFPPFLRRDQGDFPYHLRAWVPYSV